MADTTQAGFTEISPKQLMRLIGTPDCPLILDICIPEDVAETPVRIPSSQPATHDTIATRIPELIDRNVVVVCQKGQKLSHGTAALLRANGIKAEVLAGGILAWIAANLPCIPIAALPATNLWVTRHRPKIDRIACPWLIRRFVDPSATFLFVPLTEAPMVAEKFNATAFDLPSGALTHINGRCTFDAMCDHFSLDIAALRTMADVIRAADTDDTRSIPQAAGLLALSVGFSRMYRDDQAQLEATLPIYDALYRWARDGQNETHLWPFEDQS